MLCLSYLSALDLMAGSVLLVAITWEFKLGGKNNVISTASFIQFFVILLKAAINMPSNYIVRFLYLYGDI